jgi:hypothetical protein
MVTDSDVHYARVLNEEPITLFCVFIHEKNKPATIAVGKLEIR